MTGSECRAGQYFTTARSMSSTLRNWRGDGRPGWRRDTRHRDTACRTSRSGDECLFPPAHGPGALVVEHINSCRNRSISGLFWLPSSRLGASGRHGDAHAIRAWRGRRRPSSNRADRSISSERACGSHPAYPGPELQHYARFAQHIDDRFRRRYQVNPCVVAGRRDQYLSRLREVVAISDADIQLQPAFATRGEIDDRRIGDLAVRQNHLAVVRGVQKGLEIRTYR